MFQSGMLPSCYDGKIGLEQLSDMVLYRLCLALLLQSPILCASTGQFILAIIVDKKMYQYMCIFKAILLLRNYTFLQKTSEHFNSKIEQKRVSHKKISKYMYIYLQKPPCRHNVCKASVQSHCNILTQRLDAAVTLHA